MAKTHDEQVEQMEDEARGAVACRERPILFSGAMVRAILAGQKSQTRRVMRVQPTWDESRQEWSYESRKCSAHWSGPRPLACARLIANDDCPYGQPGDRLWVRETWGFRGRQLSGMDKARALTFIQYQADGATSTIVRDWDDESGLPKQREPKDGETPEDYDQYLTAYWRAWRPSIHIPRWASRLTLEVTDVRVQRLQEISEEDARAEGVTRLAEGSWGLPDWITGCITARNAFHALWNSINGERPGCSWAANPWVWAITLRRVE